MATGIFHVNTVQFSQGSTATVEGQMSYDDAQGAMSSFVDGLAGWVERCIFNHYAYVTRAGVVTDQSLASATAKGTRVLPANFFKLGKSLRYRLAGVYTTDAASGNATIQIKLGSTVFRTTGSFALDNSVTNGLWILEGSVTCQAVGAGTIGKLAGVAAWEHQETAGAGTPLHAQEMTTVAAVDIDTTISQTFDVIWTADDAGTSIQCGTFQLWELC